MKKENLLNLFWATIFGLITVLSVVGIFWNPSSIITAVLSLFMCVVFIVEYIRVQRMK